MYDPMYELEHFGIPGMKWGVRRTPAQLGHRKEKKLNRYKEKEIGKIKKRMASEAEEEKQRRKDYSNSLSDLKRKAKKERDNSDELIYETMMKQLYPTTAKEQYKILKEDDSFSRDVFKINQKEARAEIEAVKKMSYKDMQKEKIEVGKRVIKDSLRGYSEWSLAALKSGPFNPIDESYITKPSPSRTKTNIRLQQGQYAKKKPKVSKK